MRSNDFQLLVDLLIGKGVQVYIFVHKDHSDSGTYQWWYNKNAPNIYKLAFVIKPKNKK